MKDDVRESFRDITSEWTVSLNENYPFRGGAIPNLADLVIFLNELNNYLVKNIEIWKYCPYILNLPCRS